MSTCEVETIELQTRQNVDSKPKNPTQTNTKCPISPERLWCGKKRRAAVIKTAALLVQLSADNVEVRGLGALLALLDIVFDLRALIESAETLGLDCGVVNENICGLIVSLDEAEALVSVEPLDSTCCH